MAIPRREPTKMLSSTRARRTQRSWSPSSREMAIKPLALMLLNEASSVFLMLPPLVSITRYSSRLNSSTGTIEVIFSSLGMGSICTMAVPRLVRELTGI